MAAEGVEEVGNVDGAACEGEPSPAAGKGRGYGRRCGGWPKGERGGSSWSNRGKSKGKGGGWSARKASGYGYAYGGMECPPPCFESESFEGVWTDSLGNEIRVKQGTSSRGPLTAILSRDGKETVLSLRYDGYTGLWACGNAVIDVAASDENSRVWWAAYDGRRSVWRRRLDDSKNEEGDAAADVISPPDLLPWLLAPVRFDVNGAKPGDTADGDEATGDVSKDCAEGVTGDEEWAVKKDYDGGRVSALLDVRQVIGGDRAAQEALSTILVDHDLARRPGEDIMVPAVDSPLWDRLEDMPRRNALHVVTRFHAERSPSCPIEMIAHDFTQINVGRHRVLAAPTDVEALLKRWVGMQEAHVMRRTAAVAHVFSLYRSLENPLTSVHQRGMLQLGTLPSERRRAGIEYEMFASPFNAVVENGKFGSRWPHAEVCFGSAGSYPSVIEKFPEDAVVGVKPPFSDGYLEHVMGQSLERIVKRFRKVHLVVPVRDKPWRGQLRRLEGCGFVKSFWDATAQQVVSMGQPVVCWEGGELLDAV
eukprot:TRINITY_DN67814_c0_g1_i1.p1 TRINITY_DN67814_c0_g1~~TRINITY_DN67814_c0_g1_i1.p1  ORF type:complete len:564 (-),score=107.73 TRINITY_DN67814_c0_g1_i1:133-1737(-)